MSSIDADYHYFVEFIEFIIAQNTCKLVGWYIAHVQESAKSAALITINNCVSCVCCNCGSGVY